VLYVQPDDVTQFRVGRFPVFIFKGATDLDAFYGMPMFLDVGVKVARHGGPEVDPEHVDRGPSEEAISSVRRFLRGHIPDLEDARISHSEACLYTVAPADRFLVDFVNGRKDVLVASPCSGHGFKFSCLVGRVLADLATSGRTDLVIDAWQM
jgi:sarcosine oxidase